MLRAGAATLPAGDCTALAQGLRDALTPITALDVLRKGNERFVNNLKANRNLLQQVNETSNGQHPLAITLSCIDSRTSAELVFDQGLGDIFSCRIAGNVLNDDILGSMEFACKVSGAKVIVVLGHSRCGAIKGACDGVELGNLTGLLHKIGEAIALETDTVDDRSSANSAFVERVAELNVLLVKQQIIERSPLLADMVERAELAIVGGCTTWRAGRWRSTTAACSWARRDPRDPPAGGRQTPPEGSHQF